MGNKIMSNMGPIRRIFGLGAQRLIMNNLDNYFKLIIMEVKYVDLTIS
jgi:hypothetical protein